MQRNALAIVFGTILEWYDFSLFGLMASVLAKNFFPEVSKAALSWVFILFAIGFVARPLGAIFYGHIGDCYGRKKAIIWMMVSTGMASLVISLLPTFKSWGYFALLILIVCRITQGFSASTEHAGAMVFFYEIKPNFFGPALPIVGVFLGMTLAAISYFIALHFMGAKFFGDMGWRVLFLVGAGLSFVAYRLRKNLLEIIVVKPDKSPFRYITQTGKTNLMLGCLMFQFALVLPYAEFVFIPNYLIHSQLISQDFITMMNMSFLVTISLIILALSKLFDKKTYMPNYYLYLTSLFFTMLVALTFLVKGIDSERQVLLCYLLLTVLSVSIISIVPRVLNQLFVRANRLTGVSLSMNLAAIIFVVLLPLSIGKYLPPMVMIFVVLLISSLACLVAIILLSKKGII